MAATAALLKAGVGAAGIVVGDDAAGHFVTAIGEHNRPKSAVSAARLLMIRLKRAERFAT